jgi:hypothetical protein
MRRQSSHLRNNLHNMCKAIHRERGIDKKWTKQRKMSAQKTESKQSTTWSRLGSIPTKGVLVDASPRTKTTKEWEELLRNTAEQEMKTELGRGKRPRKQAQYSFERHIQVYVEEDEVDNDPYCSAASSSSSDSDASLSCTLPSIYCCCSSKNCPCRARSITRTWEDGPRASTARASTTGGETKGNGGKGFRVLEWCCAKER